jgi:hypothetical protein
MLDRSYRYLWKLKTDLDRGGTRGREVRRFMELHSLVSVWCGGEGGQYDMPCR